MRPAAAAVEPGREGGDPISATTLGLGHGPGIKLASPAPQAGTVRRPSPQPAQGREGDAMSPALAQPRINNGGWKHYINDHWFDRPELARDPDLERLAFRLERLAKEKPYALASNEELMVALGISKNTLAALLNRYELAGWGDAS